MTIVGHETTSGKQTATTGRRDDPSAATVVFLHSSFRTSSTWLWAKFRHAPNAMAYYEIFHEELATMHPDVLERVSSQSWRSNHPPTSPYFLEYLPLLRAEGGIDGYDRAMAYGRFLPAAGLQGNIGDDEAAHVSRLIDLAVKRGRTAVLSDVRTLGRVVGLKRRFGGFHIFLYRNLFHQWLSYCSQAEDGNLYFLQTIASTLRNNQHDPFFQLLVRAYFGDDPGGTTRGATDRRAAPRRGPDAPPAAIEQLFIAFVGLHLYTSIYAALSADFVLDVNRLARELSYRQHAEETIRARTGIPIDLSDARESVEYAQFRVADPLDLHQRLEAVLSKAMQSLDVGVETERARQFGRMMLDETLDEMSRYRLYTGAVFHKLAAAQSTRPAMRTLQGEFARVQSDLEAAAIRIRNRPSDLDPGAGERERERQKRKARRSIGGRLRTPLRWISKTFRSVHGTAGRGVRP